MRLTPPWKRHAKTLTGLRINLVRKMEKAWLSAADSVCGMEVDSSPEHYVDVSPERDADPVCGETVLTENARSTVHDGQVYYFCSHECREEFVADPHLHLTEEGRPDSRPSPALEFPPGGGGSHA